MALATIDRDDCRETSPRTFTHLSNAELDAIVVFVNSIFEVYSVISDDAVTAGSIPANMALKDQPTNYQKSLEVAQARYLVLLDRTADQRSEGLGQRYGFLWDERTTHKAVKPISDQLVGTLLRHGVTHEEMEARRPPPAALSTTANRGDDHPATDDPEYPDTDFREHRTAPIQVTEADGR